MNEKEIIYKCIRNDRLAQKRLYELYATKMLGVCIRYVKNADDAEDVLIEGFYKVLSSLDQFKAEGSLEGWIKRIMINESLTFLRKKSKLQVMDVDINDYHHPNVVLTDEVNADIKLCADDILKLLNQLPIGYRTIFNLYIIEGYKHQEIADMLGISINTSKSQLIMAKNKMQELLVTISYPSSNKVR
ncbi:MAG: RNA polymerase sigma factor [Saprospiraceae bacterium]|nr:RNA polymerase sigma factor [Saprospiraceae bacterium]